jgi:hypothetical protein
MPTWSLGIEPNDDRPAMTSFGADGIVDLAEAMELLGRAEICEGQVSILEYLGEFVSSQIIMYLHLLHSRKWSHSSLEHIQLCITTSSANEEHQPREPPNIPRCCRPPIAISDGPDWHGGSGYCAFRQKTLFRITSISSAQPKLPPPRSPQ